MELTTTQTTQRQQAKITDSSGKEIGSISENPEKSVLKISLNNVGESIEAASRLRELADLLERNPSNADTTADAEASAEASADAEAIAVGESSAEASANTTADAEASAEASADAEATAGKGSSAEASANTTADAEASAEASAEAEATEEGKASTEASADATADPEVSNQITSLEDLKNWVTNKQTNDASPTPGRAIREVSVESWLQVPEILRALHNNEGPLRITYPAQGNSAIADEQTAISKFLIENAGQSLAGMLAALDDKIKSCHMVTSERVSLEVTQEYLQSFSGAISAESSPLLTVAEVARLNDSFKPLKSRQPSSNQKKTAAREQILATITETMENTGEYHTCIIEVPTDYVDIAKMFINEKWTAIPEDSRPPTKHTKVWVADDFVSSASIEELDFEKFLEGAIEVPKPRQRQKKESQSSSSPLDMILS